MSAGLANSSRLAKLATDAAKPGFIEIPAGDEKEFLQDRSVRELSGIGKNRQRALAALGATTFGHVAEAALARCSGRNSASGASNSGCSPTAGGASRCCSK